MNKQELQDMAALQSVSADPTHWNSWGSPFGMMIFFMSLALSLVALGVFVWLLHVARIVHG